MKTIIIKVNLTICLVILSMVIHAQVFKPKADYQKTFLLAPRAGYDIPLFTNPNPCISYQGGIEIGLSADYYWKRLGLGFDFDYINNGTKDNFPTTNLYSFTGALLTNFSLVEKDVTRLFAGIGPDYRLETNNDKWLIELNGRIGLGSVGDGGVTHVSPGNMILSYFSGYDKKFTPSAKLQTRFNYYFNNRLGAHLGAYYMAHLGVSDINTSPTSHTIYYFDLQPYATGNQLIVPPKATTLSASRGASTLTSMGVFGGVSIKLTPREKKKKKGKYALTVTARDKFTKQVLPATDVVLKNTYGDVVATATTNSFGVVVFEDIKPDDYVIEGMLYQVRLQSSTTSENEFTSTHPLQKELLYTNLEFIVKGNVVECSSNKGIERVQVMLNDLSNGTETSVYTDKNGEYGFQVSGNKQYKIYGKKDMHMSQIETISTQGLNRSTTLFVKLEICMDEVNCDEALALRNLHYDVNQYALRDDAKLELDKVVQFMIDNPGVSLELSSHTDSRADSKYNHDLSQKRAEEAADYVVAHGIARSRITGIGYGETRLLNKCSDGIECSEAMHQVNRRTEMKVHCK